MPVCLSMTQTGHSHRGSDRSSVAALNDTLARSHAYELLPLIGGHEAIENLVDLVP
jgi:hypothetical protein